MSPSESSAPNVYAYRSRHLLSQYHERHKDVPDHKLSELKKLLHNKDPSVLPVCIIGAGTAGLYTAMILESLRINYRIIDAGTRERVGGRLFTYKFPGGGDYDYYEVGAMRFPDTPFMKRFFHLANKLPVKLIPYIMEMTKPSPNTFLFYNNARVHNQDPSVTGDPFNVSSYVTDQSLTTPQGVSNTVAGVLKPFRDSFSAQSGNQPHDIATAMSKLFKITDRFSMRGYMFEFLQMNSKDINWCETLDKSTGWYDRALTETVIESLAFDWPTASPDPDPNARWHCLDKGSSTLPQAMFKSLSQDAQNATQFQSPVTAISEDSQNNHMNISIKGKACQPYSAVISTVPLPRLGLMDLTGAKINSNYAQWSAIRELQYGPAIKIGIKFSCPWWETKLPRRIHGGQSYTDLPLRTIVYPSYPKGAAPENMSKALIVSYCWTQDAERLGALINTNGTGKAGLIDLALRDLAAVHDVSVEWLKQFYKDGDYFAWDWLHDDLTMGGFAFFGPGEYGKGDIYSEILQPAAKGKLFFAGEAASACNGWVAGALDSAWRAVDQYLALNHSKEVQEKFWKQWGPTEYWDEASNGELIDLNRKLTERHLVIALHKSGVTLPS